MMEDIKRTLCHVFGWIPTVLPEGVTLALSAGVISILFFVASAFLYIFVPFLGFLAFFAGLVILCLAMFSAYFFRNPERNTVFAADEIASPADGTVISIKTEDDPETIVVRIFLSVFDVHVQRATMSGQVEDTIYTKGAFAFADAADANKNERNLIKISRNYKYAHLEQITGAIARRIKCWVKKGEDVKIGQLVGLIRFGSQVAVYMPKDAVRVMVKEGQKVQGGQTVLALWHEAP
ncbi:phosphatidylserine decarboxylase [Elusimicrobium posterum]|uniref:phosphatidylserine decarboxylase n=1 Tax=Elusimicrobium posterum TaxID=3116653 RepID=UPI003C7449E5